MSHFCRGRRMLEFSPSRSILYFPVLWFVTWEFDLCAKQYQDVLTGCLPVRFNLLGVGRSRQEFGYKPVQKAFFLSCLFQQCVSRSACYALGPHLTGLTTPTQLQPSLGTSSSVSSLRSFGLDSHKAATLLSPLCCLPRVHVFFPKISSFEMSVNPLLFGLL